MKRNAIVRIVIFSVLILLLLSVLLASLGVDLFTVRTNSGTTVTETDPIKIPAADVSALDIEWAAGTITIVSAQVEQIEFYESSNIATKYTMVYSQEEQTLSIDYAKESVTVGISGIPSKDLIITVPEDWVCRELEIDGAALEVRIAGIQVEELTLDGAAMEFTFDGQVQSVEVDGAACELNIVSRTNPQSIQIDGAACELELTLPADCGYLVQTDGLGCSFHSDVESNSGNGTYFYGDKSCLISVEGLGCAISVYHGDHSVQATDAN